MSVYCIHLQNIKICTEFYINNLHIYIKSSGVKMSTIGHKKISLLINH